MRRFYLTNKVGYPLQDAIENPTFENSVIVVMDNSGVEIERIPVTPLTLYLYDPQPDPHYHKPMKIVTVSGEIEIPQMIPEDSVTTGENPFVQLVYRFVKKRQSANIEDIIRHITKEKKVLPENDYGISRVQSTVAEMHNGNVLGGLLVKRGNTYMAGVKLKTGRQFVKLYSGYDPFEYQIIHNIENKGLSSRDEIHRLIMDELKWARNSKLVEFYIKKLLKQGNIRRIDKDWFEYKQSLEPF